MALAYVDFGMSRAAAPGARVEVAFFPGIADQIKEKALARLSLRSIATCGSQSMILSARCLRRMIRRRRVTRTSCSRASAGGIKDGFADPDFGPCEAAARAGISLRYLQKMFTQRGSTCSEFIYSFRLDHAARLLQRQAALHASQALREIAYASGFRDYHHFARKFRHRFGHAPGAHFAGEGCDRAGALNGCG